MQCTGTWWFVVAFVLLLSVKDVKSARILALCVVPSPSHSLWCYQYMAALAESGHQITVFGVDKPKNKIANTTTFIVKSIYDRLHSQMDLAADWAVENKSKLDSIHPGLTYFNELATRAVMESQELQALMDHYKNVDKPFDLIIHDNIVGEALLGLVPLFGNPPLLLATTFGIPQYMVFRKGNIFNPAYVPSMITSGDQHMTFYERCVNTFYYFYIQCAYEWVMEPFQNKIMHAFFGEDLPHLRDILNRANIIIVNYNFALDGSRPLLPGVIGISGLHISEPKPLLKDIKEFMDGAKEGVILLSFGTNVDSKWFEKDFERKILDTLVQLPQRVLWKWDKILDDLPPNVKMSKWLPQADIMAHPKMCLFITHCGLLSTQEALYRKVPILALPVFLDQTDIAAKLVKLELTIRLNVYRLTSDHLLGGIKEILTNPKYKRNMKKMGELMADTPMTAKQSAVYWTEYAIRHQGAAHLHSVSADLPWHQLLLLDVLGMVLALILATVWLLKDFVRIVAKKLKQTKIKYKRN